MTLAEHIAKIIRDNVSDPDHCVENEDECFRLHPIHEAASSNGVCMSAFVEIDATAEIIARGLEHHLVEALGA